MARRKLTLIILALLVCLLIGCTTAPSSYDQLLIQKGKQSISEMGVNKDIDYSVTRENDLYIININGNTQKVGMLPPDNSKIKILNISSINSEIEKLANTAKNNVIDYVKSSNILKNKKDILHYLNKVEIKIAEMDAPAMYEDSVIYIGKDYLDVDEWTICHEYFHSIADFTNGGIEPYAYYTFDEALTDILTSSISPEKSDTYESKYVDYHENILRYIGCFEEEAIKAYFYGYDDLWRKVGKDEFNFWVYSLENYFSNDFAVVCVLSFENKWAQN